MKKTVFPLLLSLTCAFAVESGFAPGGSSVKLPEPQTAKRAASAPNRVFNGSFELAGTKPDGWNQQKQKGWCGFFNIDKGKTPEEQAWHKKIRAAAVRKIVPDAAEGKAALAIITPKSLEVPGKKFPMVSSKVYQIVTVPETPATGARYTLTFKVRGTSGSSLTVFLRCLKATPDGKTKNLAPSLIRTFPLTAEWRTISLTTDAKPGTDRFDLTLALYGTGELYIDDVSLTQDAVKDPVTVASLPSALTGDFTAIGEKQPAILTFTFDAVGKIERKALRLEIELPDGFTLTDARTRSRLTVQNGRICQFDLMRYPEKHLRDHYQYQAASIMVESPLPASEKLFPLRYRLVDGAWKGETHSMMLKIIPTFSGLKPRHFKTAAMFGHEIEFGPVGTAKLAEFYRRSGFNCVNGAAHNREFAALMKKFGFERFDEEYNLANGYRLGAAPKPENAKFRRIDGSAFPNKVCPVEIYREGDYFRSAVKGLIENRIVTRDETDSLMPNWEPYYLDSKGCFCDRCREEFVRYCQGTPAPEEIRQAWPRDLFKKHFAQWQKFRSWQHGRLLATLEKNTVEAGKKVGKESHFIPEITYSLLLPNRYHVNAQYGALDYAWDLPWLEPWGPYFWHSLRDYNEKFPANHLATYLMAAESKSFLRDRAPRGARIPKLIAFPHGWQDSFYVTTPEALQMDMISFFMQNWEGAFLYYFPRGYDYRYWKAAAVANDRIARAETFLRDGKDATSRIAIEPVTGLPKLYFMPKFEEVPGMKPLLPGLAKASPIQFRAFDRNGKMLVAVANFWENGEHFFRLKIAGLQGKYAVGVPGARRGIFSGTELAQGILMQVGALNWQFITVAQPEAEDRTPLVDNARMEALLAARTPAIDAGLRREATLFAQRFGAADYTALRPVAGGGLSARGTADRHIELRAPGAIWRIAPDKGGSIVNPFSLAVPAFWWTVKGPAELTKPFRVTRLAAQADGIELEMARTLTIADKAELAELKITLTYRFTRNGFTVTAELKNPTEDSMAFAFRFKNMPAGMTFTFPGNRSFDRNKLVSLFRTGTPDGELDGIHRCERTAKVDAGTVRIGGLSFHTRPVPYGYICWDGAAQANATFEPVFDKIILAPGKSISYSMTVTHKKGK